MMAGGREVVFGGDQKEIFEAGINAVVIGGYLNAKGDEVERDKRMLSSYGFNIASVCH
jgi:biotin synthase